MSQIFIQTRGTSIDYKFLIKSPSPTWWRDYRDLTSFEDPTLIIENIDGSPRIYLSAIPSERKDRVNTRIRYTLVVEIEKDDHTLDDFVLKLVSTWVNEVGQSSKYKPINSKIGNMLDKHFSEEFVDGFLGLKYPENQNIDELNDKLKNFQQEISKLTKPETIYDNASWWGGIGNEKNRQDWIALVDKLVSNKSYGKALFLNLAAEENDIQDILRDTTGQIICLINGNSDQQQFSVIEKIKIFISKLKHLKSFVVISVCILFVFLITFNLIGFSGNRLSESKVIQYVAKSCKEEKTSANSTPTLPKPETQSTASKTTPNSPKPETQSTSNSPKPAIPVTKEEIVTTEELAEKLNVSKDELLSEVKKCHESFKTWSKKFEKGTWDFKINGSQLTFKKVNF